MRTNPLIFCVLCLCTLGLVSRAAAQPLEPVRVGATLSVTGKYQAPASMVGMAYRLWARQVSERGGLQGRPVKLTVYDDQSDPARSARLYEKLIVEDHVDLVLSPYSSALTHAASAVTERHGFVMLAAGASSEKIWERGFRNVFGVYAPAGRYFIGFLDLMGRQGFKTLALLYEKSDFPAQAAGGVRTWASRFGLRMVLDRAFLRGQEELPTLLEAAKRASPDGLILCAYPKDCYVLLGLVRASRFRPPALGMTIAPALPDFGKRAGPEAQGVFGPSQWEPDERIPFPGTKSFIQDFRTFTGKMPSYHAGAGYAACQVLEQAINRAGTLNQERIRDRIYALDTVTVIGRFRVDHTGKQVGHSPLLIQWQGGKKEIVYPTRMRTAEPVF